MTLNKIHNFQRLTAQSGIICLVQNFSAQIRAKFKFDSESNDNFSYSILELKAIFEMLNNGQKTLQLEISRLL